VGQGAVHTSGAQQRRAAPHGAVHIPGAQQRRAAPHGAVCA